MVRRVFRMLVMTAVGLVISAGLVLSENVSPNYDDDEYQYTDRSRIDRYLDVEVWTNHSDGEYYEGDNIVISYRANRDAFVAIYSIDTRGRVDLLFPSAPDQDNFIRGGVSYRLPSGLDDFDLAVTGPEGAENIQVIASRERFPIPDWYPTSGLICDWDDRHDYMDYLNNRYFVRYDGQRFAYDRTAIYVDEWEPYYFQPVYYPAYPSWTVCGNVYIDYPIGASVYINGIYWGCAPLYIPRIYVGWHTITIYDYYGYCWESDFHVTRYHTVVLGHEVIRTSQTGVSKYKEVRYAGYRNPVANGYPQYKQQRSAIMKAASVVSKAAVADDFLVSKKTEAFLSGHKKYARGNTKIVKTERGLETTGSVYGVTKSNKNAEGSHSRTTSMGKIKGSITTDSPGSSTKSSIVGGKDRSSGSKGYVGSKSTTDSKTSSGYYKKKSGSDHKRGSKIKSSTIKKESDQSQKVKATKSYQPTKATGNSGDSKKSSSSYKSHSSSKQSSPSISKPSGKSGSTGGKKASSGGKGKR